jgi:tRNA-specific 2-thiouridylase
MSDQPHVVVAMSGGVDSSVAAALLVEQGYRVTGMMLRLWSEPGLEESNRCCTPDAMLQARRVAAILNIPFYAIDGRERFRNTVVQAFLDGYASGETPNPCITCNRLMRWGLLLDEARAIGADFLATGHYARLKRQEDGRVSLLTGIDSTKDQAYVLSILTQEQLQHSLLPVGQFPKTEIRRLAHHYGLPVAERPDSQDLCFLAGGDYREFLGRYLPETQAPGPIIDRQGRQLGQHLGLADYTIGQRKGLRIAASQPLYVLEKIQSTNTLVVGTEDELGRSELELHDVNWISGFAPDGEFDANIKIRYKATPMAGRVTPKGEYSASIRFAQPLRDITAGQIAAILLDEVVLGGGWISPKE